MSESPKLLIVDDDEGIRRSFARIMRLQGFRVEVASDGETAIETAEQFSPDLLILDIRLPGIDGVDTFSAIRKLLPRVPAVFMTAYAACDRARAAHELGAISVFTKPLDIKAIVELATDNLQDAAVLVVDDDFDLLNSLARALNSAKVEVQTASSLREAIQMTRQRPDRVVIADVFLNDGFGYELLCDMSRTDKDYSLVLVTGKDEWLQLPLPKHIAEAKLNCIRKPLDIDSLLSHIRNFQRPNSILKPQAPDLASPDEKL